MNITRNYCLSISGDYSHYLFLFQLSFVFFSVPHLEFMSNFSTHSHNIISHRPHAPPHPTKYPCWCCNKSFTSFTFYSLTPIIGWDWVRPQHQHFISWLQRTRAREAFIGWFVEIPWRLPLITASKVTLLPIWIMLPNQICWLLITAMSWSSVWILGLILPFKLWKQLLRAPAITIKINITI